MKDLYECGTCGVVTESQSHLCSPRPVSGKEDYCGTTLETSEMCGTMVQTLEYECGTCGRPAEQAELVCNPAKAR
jgi:hypothetical protein